MDLDAAFMISASGLDAQKERLNVISSNLSNVDSTRTPEGGPYRRKDVVFSTVDTGNSFESALSSITSKSEQGVEVSDVISDTRPFKQVYNPQHPDADASGYVLFPNVNPMEEMVNMISASRSYEANVTAFNATKNMALKALEIGK
ncbi:MAG: flagellar basal body rod protein FlgC [Nitrospirae bacterium]|nr:flagellar basal body rod protein FlgC [Nitrospirota bacterium]